VPTVIFKPLPTLNTGCTN